MEYFLPIAQVEINLLFIFGLSLVVGILSGLFGVGGGFLMTPFLIFLGIPPAYAVPNEASNILGTSVSGSTTHYLKGTLDYKMGLMIVIGGTIGTLLGILTFSYFKDIGKISNSDHTVLIRGESGTGKEMIGRAIHANSLNNKGPYIQVNVTAIPADLLESELFGYEKGAFTGAEKKKSGRFEEADNGTILLDEIGDMSIDLQSKLLRVIEEKNSL